MIKPIKNEDDLYSALERIDALWGAEDGTAEGDELEVLTVLVGAYESEHHELPPGDPIEILRFKMAEKDLTQNGLADLLGISSGRMSEVFNGHRELTLNMIRKARENLDIPADALIGGESVSESPHWIDLPQDLWSLAAAQAESLGQGVRDWICTVIANQIVAYESGSFTKSFDESPTSVGSGILGFDTCTSIEVRIGGQGAAA